MSSPEGNTFVSLESALISPFLRCKNFHFKRKSSLFLLVVFYFRDFNVQSFCLFWREIYLDRKKDIKFRDLFTRNRENRETKDSQKVPITLLAMTNHGS